MHLTVELHNAIAHFHHVACTLPGFAGKDQASSPRRLQQADLWELMQCSASVYNLAQSQLNAWPPAPKLRLVPNFEAEPDDRKDEPRVDEAPERPANATKPRSPRP